MLEPSSPDEVLHRRRIRDEQNAIRALVVTLPTKVAVFIDESFILSKLGDLAIISIEIMTVVTYFLFAQQVDCNVRRTPIDFGNTPLPWPGVVFNGVMSIFFIIHFVWMVFLASNRRSFVMSVYAIISAATIVTMGLSFVLARDENDNTAVEYDYYDRSSTAQTIWAPAFLRVWWAHRQTGHVLSKYRQMLHPAIKEMIILGTFVLSLIVTGTGCQQYFDAWGSTCTKSIVNAFYLIMVTVTTLGYGDVVPVTGSGKLMISLTIFAAMFFLPVALGKIGELAAYLSSQNSYTHTARHVVVCGQFGIVDLKVMICEFLFDPSRRSGVPLNVVLVTEQPLDESIFRWLRQPSLRDRVTVCVSDALRKGQIRRYRARAAEAVVLLSSRTAVAQRGDYETMMKSIVFHRYEPGVPQLMLLKRGMHIDAMRRTANVIFERERLKYHLMGIAVRLPLFVPFIVNLLKSSESATSGGHSSRGSSASHRRRHPPPTQLGGEHQPLNEWGVSPTPTPAESTTTTGTDEGVFCDGTFDDWWELYLGGASCNLHVVPAPPTLHARLFSAAVTILNTRMSITVIGILRRGSEPGDEDEVLMCAMKEKILPSDRLIVIGPCTLDVSNFTDAFMNSHRRISGALPSMRRSRRPSTSLQQRSPVGDGAPPVSAARTGSRRSNAFPFRDHVLLVDLSSAAASAQNLNAEENIECEQFQALDIVRLLRHVIQKGLADEEHIPVVLLSGQTMSRYLVDAWPEIARPIYHLRGYGTESSHLRTAGVADARAIVLFFSSECERPDATIHLVAHVMFEMLAAVGREKEVPIIVEVDDLSLSYLVPPRMSALADEALNERARANYSCAPSFFSGRVIASTMIDTIVFQTLHNPSIPKILTSLMGIAEDDGDMLRRLKRFGSVSNSEARIRKRQRNRPRRRASPQMMSTNGVFQLDTVFCASIDRFVPPTMLPHEIATLSYGELVCFAVKVGCILLGLRRSVNTVDLGQHMVGTPFLATNPPTDTQLVPSDEVYFLYIESTEPAP